MKKEELQGTEKKANIKIKKSGTSASLMEEGKQVWAKTILPTELVYIKEIADKEKAGVDEVFHHEGIPDIMRITKSGKLQFYEIKPLKGSADKRLLNLNQKETIRRLLLNKMVKSVTMVYYEKKDGKIIYPAQMRLTLENIDQYSI